MRQSSRKDAGAPAVLKATTDRTSCKTVREIHPDAAGIDVGSREHYVAVPADRDERPVQRFGCLTADLHVMARWLKANRKLKLNVSSNSLLSQLRSSWLRRLVGTKATKTTSLVSSRSKRTKQLV